MNQNTRGRGNRQKKPSSHSATDRRSEEKTQDPHPEGVVNSSVVIIIQEVYIIYTETFSCGCTNEPPDAVHGTMSHDVNAVDVRNSALRCVVLELPC